MPFSSVSIANFEQVIVFDGLCKVSLHNYIAMQLIRT